MSDGKIEIESEINTSKLAKGEKEVTKSLKNIEKSVEGVNKAENSNLTTAGKLGAAATGLGIAFAAVGATAKKAKDAVIDLTSAYKTQVKAETQLQTAVNNSPYINGQGASNLKQYASYLQTISSYGDEQLIPLMSELVSAGRSEAEVMDIMKASINMAASGAVSLDQAVQGLNQSYAGQIGTLGRYLPQLKELTTEELKSGKAVEEVAKVFDGMSERVTNNIGSAEQLSMAFGDLKETLGANLADSLKPFEKSLTNVITKINESLTKARELKHFRDNLEDTLNGNSSYDQTLNTLNGLSAEHQKQTEYLTKLYRYKALLDSTDKAEIKERNEIYKAIKKDMEAMAMPGMTDFDLVNTVIAETEQENRKRAAQIKDLQDLINDMSATPATTVTATDADENQASDIRKQLRDQYNQTVADKKKELELQKKIASETGEEWNQAQADEELYNTMYQAWIQKIVDSKGLLTGNYEIEQEELKEIVDLYKQIPAEETEVADKYKELKDALSEIGIEDTRSIIEQLTDQLNNLDEIMAKSEGLEESSDLYQEYAEKRLELIRQITDAEKEAAQEQKDAIVETFNSIKNTISEIASTTSSITDLALENISDVQELNNEQIDKDYNDGVISYEEYTKKLEQIDKEAAKKEYKVKLAEWTMNLAEATANIASGIAQAINSPFPQNLINGALVSAAGGVQLATIMSNKPIAPSFASGGIVGGSSYSGDRVQANVNSGEMILNAEQQLALWKAANSSGSSGGLNQQITVNNNAGDVASASATIDNNQIVITVEKIVNKGFSDGKFTDAMLNAQSKKSGVRYL